MRDQCRCAHRRHRSGRSALQAQRRVDDPRQLVGVGRVGGVAGALQPCGEAAGVLALRQHLLVARAVLHQPRVVGEGLGVAGVGAELRHALARAGRRRTSVVMISATGALPVGAGLDAEQVVRRRCRRHGGSPAGPSRSRAPPGRS